jgi:hypothetical protein
MGSGNKHSHSDAGVFQAKRKFFLANQVRKQIVGGAVDIM